MDSWTSESETGIYPGIYITFPGQLCKGCNYPLTN